MLAQCRGWAANEDGLAVLAAAGDKKAYRAVAARCALVAEAPSAPVAALACGILAYGGYCGPVRFGTQT